MTATAHRLSISWTSLRRWEECAHKHRLVQEGYGLPPDGRRFLQGTVSDRVMRQWLDTDNPQPGEMAEMVGPMMRRFVEPQTEQEKFDPDRHPRIRWKGDPRIDVANMTANVRELMVGLEPILLELVLPYYYFPELKFRTTIGIPWLDGTTIAPVDLIGGIDIVVARAKDGDRYHQFDLFDFKSSRDPQYVKTTLAQGVFYDVAFGNWWGNHAEPERFGFITPGTKEKVVWVSITPQERRELVGRIIRMAHALWRAQDVPTPGSHCSQCEVKHACEVFNAAVTRDEQGRNRVSFAKAAERRTKDL